LRVSDTERAWFVLAKARLRAGEVTVLLDLFGTPESVVAQSASALRNAGVGEAARHAILHPDEDSMAMDLDWLSQDDCSIVCWRSDHYPQLLAEIDDPPILIYVRGDVDALQLPMLAIVGSRNPTRGGLQTAFEFSRHLARTGFCIASGLAQGIDTAAHTGALEPGGMTVAVLGHGIDRIYPAANRDLAHRIAKSGALVSEYPLGSPPRREHFPQRNRLISGMSLGTLVVEAAKRSGSLITARLAAEQGREVFAIPGSIHNALSRGCHQLIRQGAKLVESADDIQSELGPLVGHLMQNATAALQTDDISTKRDADYEALLAVMGHDPMSADQLASESGLTIEQVSSMLLILELEGDIEALNGGQYSKLGSRSRDERERARRPDVSF
jgi:DNA processing protein